MAGVARPLADRHRVVRVDLLGHGRSDAPHESAAYAMERCTAQLAGVLDALAIPRAHLLGYSMGGRIALALAALHPGRVASAASRCCRPRIPPSAQRVRATTALTDRSNATVCASVSWMALPLFATQRRLSRRRRANSS
jgi:pimeloyl-ACP methyl ester carboxylesterase